MLPLGREIVFTITGIIYRHAPRVKIILYSIRPAKSTVVKESLKPDLDLIYYRILNKPIRFCCCIIIKKAKSMLLLFSFLFFLSLFASFYK